MPIRPPSAAGLAVLGLLAACAPTPGATPVVTPAGTPTSGDQTCADRLLDLGGPGVALPGETPVWTIANSGPNALVLTSPGDRSLAIPYPPNQGGKPALFIGDARYDYRLDVAPGGRTAMVRICWPTP